MIFVEKCSNYKIENVKKSIFKILDNSPLNSDLEGKSVFLKVNLLRKETPDRNVTTHPTVVEAICEYILSKNGLPIIGDSPAGPFTKPALNGIYETSGLFEVSKKTGAKLNHNLNFSEVDMPDALMLKKIMVIDAVREADMVISVAKLKTHGMMTYTGAVKNLFGVVPGLTKAKYHIKLENPTNFANHLLDICDYIKPVFCIIDGIEAMEGDGPNSGFTRELGYLMGGENPYDLDEVALMATKIKRETVPTIIQASKRGLSSSNIEMNIDKSEFDDIKPFVLPKSISVNFVEGRMPDFLSKFLVGSIKSKPMFKTKLCIGCSHCARICPAEIIVMKEMKAGFNKKKCISCFCCHEVCPVDAIGIKTPILGKILLKG